MTTYYKILGKDRQPLHGGAGQWTFPGEWMPTIADIEPCVRGYHLVTVDQLIYWLGPEIYVADGRGEHVQESDKHVFSEARLIRRVEEWDDRTARLFACDCAERALKIAKVMDRRSWNAIQVAREFAEGKASRKKLKEAQRSAAYAYAAYDYAAYAAYAAAATYAAAAAAAAVATYAAVAAAVAAAANEREWQTGKLKEYLQL